MVDLSWEEYERILDWLNEWADDNTLTHLDVTILSKLAKVEKKEAEKRDK